MSSRPTPTVGEGASPEGEKISVLASSLSEIDTCTSRAMDLCHQTSRIGYNSRIRLWIRGFGGVSSVDAGSTWWYALTLGGAYAAGCVLRVYIRVIVGLGLKHLCIQWKMVIYSDMWEQHRYIVFPINQCTLVSQYANIYFHVMFQ